MFWKHNERKLSVSELTKELAIIEEKISELNSEGPKEGHGERGRQSLLTILHRAKQGLMMIRAERFKKDLTNK